MKRDLDLIRQILLAVEAAGDDTLGGWVELDLDGYSDETVAHHVCLLYEAGLIDAHDACASGSYRWYPKQLTWDGHEFLDAARNEKWWRRAKAQIAEAGSGLSFELVKALLIQIAKGKLGIAGP